jgi:type VI secretion system FHA domain protein
MALRLRIVSDHRRQLGPRASAVFGVTGGSIGRSADNDWVLPDPSRFVSSRHARIHFSGGVFFIEDTSTNGTYVNDAEYPLPKSIPQELHNGDMIRFGEYHVVVTLDGYTDITSERSAMVNLESTIGTGSMSAASPAPEFDVSISANTLFGSGSESGEVSGLRAANAYGQAVIVPLVSNGQSQGRADRAMVDLAMEDSSRIAARRMERLARAVQKREGLGVASPADDRAGLDAFCRGAGIDPVNLPADGAAGMMQVAGQLLRESLISLKELDSKQSEFRSAFRLPPARDDEPQGFQANASTDDLLVALLASHNSRRLDAAQWLRQCFEKQTRHHDALSAGARVGLVEFLRQLDPKQLEQRFEQTPKRNLMGGRPSNWEMYTEFYKLLSERQPESGVPSLYAESLSNAYQAVAKKSGS